MELPFSRSQVDKLGERLRKSARPSEADFKALQDFRAQHDEPLAQVASILRADLKIDPTTRLKTVNTLIEKLKREKSRLSSVQDIAGARVVRDMTLTDQDLLVKRVIQRFPKARVVDRRANPSHGYRAVHLILEVDGRQVELQLRTPLQDLWAQAMERFADRVGREIRYGLPLRDPEERIGASAVSDLLSELTKQSEMIAVLERLRVVGLENLRLNKAWFSRVPQVEKWKHRREEKRTSERLAEGNAAANQLKLDLTELIKRFKEER